MMTKLFYIACFFILIQDNVSGQVAHATISATITTPVGAEISGDISLETFPVKMSSTKTNENITKAVNNETRSFLKVIGESFAHTITLENDMVLLKRKKDSNESYQPPQQYRPSLSVTVNFD